MIYAKLFLTFLEIGIVSFGGGYGMISMIREKVLSYGWLTEEEFLNLIAVSESTPGPIAVNMATFIGSEEGGILGSLVATLGAIIPAFIIVVILAAAAKNFLGNSGVQAFLSGVRPCVVGLIIATALIMVLQILFGIKSFGNPVKPDLTDIAIFAGLIAISLIYRKIRKKNPSPIVMIIISGIVGILIG